MERCQGMARITHRGKLEGDRDGEMVAVVVNKQMIIKSPLLVLGLDPETIQNRGVVSKDSHKT